MDRNEKVVLVEWMQNELEHITKQQQQEIAVIAETTADNVNINAHTTAGEVMALVDILEQSQKSLSSSDQSNFNSFVAAVAQQGNNPSNVDIGKEFKKHFGMTPDVAWGVFFVCALGAQFVYTGADPKVIWPLISNSKNFFNTIKALHEKYE